MYTPSGEYLTAISRGRVLIIEADSLDVAYYCQLFDGFAGIQNVGLFQRPVSMVSLVYTSRRIACGSFFDEIGWIEQFELLFCSCSFDSVLIEQLESWTDLHCHDTSTGVTE